MEHVDSRLSRRALLASSGASAATLAGGAVLSDGSAAASFRRSAVTPSRSRSGRRSGGAGAENAPRRRDLRRARSAGAARHLGRGDHRSASGARRRRYRRRVRQLDLPLSEVADAALFLGRPDELTLSYWNPAIYLDLLDRAAAPKRPQHRPHRSHPPTQRSEANLVPDCDRVVMRRPRMRSG
jgi:hypothetical protein